MAYRILADLVLVLHLLFIAFAMFGGLLALWKRWLMLPHVAAVGWAALAVGLGWICPLTPLENTLRHMTGQAGYNGSFIEHYLLLAIYPPGLTREIQLLLALLLIAGNGLIYIELFRRRASKQAGLRVK